MIPALVKRSSRGSMSQSDLRGNNLIRKGANTPAIVAMTAKGLGVDTPKDNTIQGEKLTAIHQTNESRENKEVDREGEKTEALYIFSFENSKIRSN